MEYFLGSIVTLVIVFIIMTFFKKEKTVLKSLKISYSQSHIYELIKDFIPFAIVEKIETQARKYQKNNQLRIVFIGSDAYWIKDNSLYTAKQEGGEIEEDTTSKVDMYAIDDVELKKMVFVVDILTKGLTDENRDSGNK